MVSLNQLRKDHAASGAFHTLVNVSGFIDKGTLLTYSGDVACVLGFRGPDAECLEPGQRDSLTARFAAAMRVFDEGFVVNSYLIKRSNPPIEAENYEEPFINRAVQNRREYLIKERDLYSFETCLVITRKADWRRPGLRKWLARILNHPASSARESLSTPARMRALNQPLERATARLQGAVNSFIEQVGEDVNLRVFDRKEVFRFLRRLLNPDREKADAVSLKHNRFVDFFAVDSELACHRSYLRLGNSFIKVLTLKEPPTHTFANILRDLSGVRADLVVVTEWTPWDSARAISMMRSKRRHFHNTKIALSSQIGSERPYEREIIFDGSKEALVSDLGRCMEEMEMRGVQIGEFTLTVLVLAETLEAVERACAEVFRVVGAHEGVVNEETYAALNAFLATIPGGYLYNLRKC